MDADLVNSIRIESQISRPVSDKWVLLPHTLNLDTCGGLVPEIIKAIDDPRVEVVLLDFRNLQKVEPEGVTLLSNMLVLISAKQKDVRLVLSPTSGTIALIHFGFVAIHRKLVFNYSAIEWNAKLSQRRDTAVLKLTEVRNVQYPFFLAHDFVPWLAHEIGTTEESLYSYSSLVGEVFQNIAHHSNTQHGCTFSEHLPSLRLVTTAISDCGITIPARVRSIFPHFTDTQCLLKACEEGFTTQTNVKNRGAGLNLLLAYVVQAYGGRVTILSGNARLVATNESLGVKLRSKTMSWLYPGTLVLISLDVARLLPALARDSEPEVFKWS